MKQFDIFLNPPQLKDPDEQREMAQFCAKLQEILQFINDNLGVIPIVSSAPTIKELEETANAKGEIRSEVKILDSSVAGNRKIYYRFQGNLRTITGA